jgi:hypothetical protein
VQAAQSGAARVPPRTRLKSPQPEHRAQRFWQALHQGRPVALEVSQALTCPQIVHVIRVLGRQARQSGPCGVRTLTGRRWPQLAQVSWLRGSVVWQCEQTGCPFSSRIAAFRWLPQREHGTAIALATQREQLHRPSTRLNRRTTFWQPGQAGATILVAPAA